MTYSPGLAPQVQQDQAVLQEEGGPAARASNKRPQVRFTSVTNSFVDIQVRARQEVSEAVRELVMQIGHTKGHSATQKERNVVQHCVPSTNFKSLAQVMPGVFGDSTCCCSSTLTADVP